MKPHTQNLPVLPGIMQSFLFHFPEQVLRFYLLLARNSCSHFCSARTNRFVLPGMKHAHFAKNPKPFLFHSIMIQIIFDTVSHVSRVHDLLVNVHTIYMLHVYLLKATGMSLWKCFWFFFLIENICEHVWRNKGQLKLSTLLFVFHEPSF